MTDDGFTCEWERELYKNENDYKNDNERSEVDKRPWISAIFGKYWDSSPAQRKWYRFIDLLNKWVPILQECLFVWNTCESIFNLCLQFTHRNVNEKLIIGIMQCAYRGLISNFTGNPQDYFIDDGLGVEFQISGTNKLFHYSFLKNPSIYFNKASVASPRASASLMNSF
jgi:hypothetical protein